MPRIMISPDTIEEIVSMAKTEEFSPDQIAAEVGASLSVVRKVLKDHGIELHRATRIDRLGPEKCEDICRRYLAGERVKIIISDHRIDYNLLYAVLAQAGVDSRIRENFLNDSFDRRQQTAIAMYDAGEPLWRIKAETGFHQPQLHSLLHEAGIPLRRDRARETKANENKENRRWEPSNVRPDGGSTGSDAVPPIGTDGE